MGHVEERDDPPHLLAFLESDLPLVLSVGQVPELGEPLRDGVLYPLLQGPHVVLGLTLRRVQRHAIRADVVVVQVFHLLRVDLAGKPERLSAPAPPLARRLLAPAVVGRPSALGDVLDVIPLG